ncbi:hypothetical protein [Colwellia sp. Arc7-635]|uniref:hypothetical protein n=1 Tax=Colwellia sp. Arc7-635 TaxID=2497879 RepID=UPI0019D30CDB|nr:hypothetical protein [Colwellia sp. Arc7-635]
MSAFNALKVLILFIVCLVFDQLIMIYGYATYLPQFGSDVNAEYIRTMWFHFSILGIACALLTFFLSKAFLLSFKVSLIIFILSGIVFNLYTPEGNQWHWNNGFIDLSFLYMLFGLLVLFVLNYTKSSVQKSPNKKINKD